MPAFLTSKKTLLILGGIFFTVLVVLLLVMNNLWGRVHNVNLTYYGLWEESAVFAEVISDWQRLHPNVRVSYQQQNQINYRERIMNSLQRPDGPDIVRIHASWLPMFRRLIAPVPQSVFTPSGYRTTFYPAAVNDLTLGGRPYAIPLEIDGLVLFVNTDLLAQAGLSPAKSWEDFQDQVQRLTVRNSVGKITVAGAALGTASNVDHWQDILSLMFFQNGADINVPSGDAAAGALRFYTGFVTKLHVWDETLDNSTSAFARGKVVYYFAPTWRYFDIKGLSKNSRLNFKMLPIPQLPGNTVGLSTYWAEAVSNKSPNQKEAFEFLQYLSQKENQEKLYLAQSKLRQFGEPYSRRDLQTSLLPDPNVGPFLALADGAQSSYLASFTWDGPTGINSRMSRAYQEAVNSALRGDAASALRTTSSEVAQVLGDYGVPVGR